MTNPLDHVDQLSAWLQVTDIGLFELSGPNGTLRLLNDGGSVHVAGGKEQTPAEGIVAVRAPSLGVFLDRHPLHDQSIAAIGAAIRTGEPLGFLQVGSLLTAVLAPQGGTVIDVLVENGAVVGYGATLFELQPTEGETP
jgi:acetyl-CoA carboxylase biotin carboxyl carrier protein